MIMLKNARNDTQGNTRQSLFKNRRQHHTRFEVVSRFLIWKP